MVVQACTCSALSCQVTDQLHALCSFVACSVYRDWHCSDQACPLLQADHILLSLRMVALGLL